MVSNYYNNILLYIIIMSWSEQAILIGSDTTDGDQFGYSIAASGDGTHICIGSISESTNTGAVYYFKKQNRTTWSQVSKFTAAESSSGDYFGTSVAMDSEGQYLIVGADRESTNGSNSGATYFFKRNQSTWSEMNRIVPSVTGANNYYGCQAVMNPSGTYGAISAKGNNKVFVFTRSGNTWSEQQAITHTSPTSDDNFGSGLAISNNADYLIAGAPYDDITTGDAGAGYIFKRTDTTWSQQIAHGGTKPTFNEKMGIFNAISANGDWAIFSNFADDTNNTNGGIGYLMKRNGNTWSQFSELVNSDNTNNDYFTYGLSMNRDNTSMLINTNNSKLYIFNLNSETNTWSESQIITPSFSSEDMKTSVINGNYAYVGDILADKVVILYRENNPASGGDPYVVPIRCTDKIIKLPVTHGNYYNYFSFTNSIEKLDVNVMTWIPQMKIDWGKRDINIDPRVYELLDEQHSYIRYLGIYYHRKDLQYTEKMIIDLEDLKIKDHQVPNLKKLLTNCLLNDIEYVPVFQNLNLSSQYFSEKVNILGYQGSKVPEKKLTFTSRLGNEIQFVLGQVKEQPLFRNYLHLVNPKKYKTGNQYSGLMIDYKNYTPIDNLF